MALGVMPATSAQDVAVSSSPSDSASSTVSRAGCARARMAFGSVRIFGFNARRRTGVLFAALMARSVLDHQDMKHYFRNMSFRIRLNDLPLVVGAKAVSFLGDEVATVALMLRLQNSGAGPGAI